MTAVIDKLFGRHYACGTKASGMKPIVATLLLLPFPLFGQLAGIHLIEPDPNDGRPLLVHSPCTEQTTDPETMFQPQAIPISVYSDPEIELFVDRHCIIASVQFGYGENGLYQV